MGRKTSCVASIKLIVTQISRSVCSENYKYLDIYKLIYKLFVLLYTRYIYYSAIVYILVKKEAYNVSRKEIHKYNSQFLIYT